MTSALHAEGPRFDPGFVYPFLHAPVHAAVRMHPCMQGSIQRASIAQMVERKTLNLVVVGSIPTGGAFLLMVTLEGGRWKCVRFRHSPRSVMDNAYPS